MDMPRSTSGHRWGLLPSCQVSNVLVFSTVKKVLVDGIDISCIELVPLTCLVVFNLDKKRPSISLEP